MSPFFLLFLPSSTLKPPKPSFNRPTQKLTQTTATPQPSGINYLLDHVSLSKKHRVEVRRKEPSQLSQKPTPDYVELSAMSGNNRNDNVAGEEPTDQQTGHNSNNEEVGNNNLDLLAGNYGDLGLDLPVQGFNGYLDMLNEGGLYDLGLPGQGRGDDAAQIRDHDPVGGYPNLHNEGEGHGDFLNNLGQVENAANYVDFNAWLHDVDEIAGGNDENREPDDIEVADAGAMRDQRANDDGYDPDEMDIEVADAGAMQDQRANDDGNDPDEMDIDDAEAVPNQSAPRTQNKRNRRNKAKGNVFVPPPPMEITAETKARDVAAHWSRDRIPTLKTISGETEEMGEKEAKRWPETRPFNGTPIFSRPGYVRALLIQTYADVTSKPCDHCRSNMGRFTECVRDPRMGGGGCASCLWSSRHKKCNYHKEHPNTWHDGIPAVVEAPVKDEVREMEQSLSDMLHACKDDDDREAIHMKLAQLRSSRELLESCYDGCKEFLHRKNTENADNPENPENPETPE